MWLNSSCESNGTFEAEFIKQLSLSSAVSFGCRASKCAALNSEVDTDLRGQAHEQLKDLVEVSNACEAENNSVAESVDDAVVGDRGGSSVVPDVVEQHVDRSSNQGNDQTPKLPEHQKKQIVQVWVIEENYEVLHLKRGSGLRGNHCHSNEGENCFIISSHSRLIEKYFLSIN